MYSCIAFFILVILFTLLFIIIIIIYCIPLLLLNVSELLSHYSIKFIVFFKKEILIKCKQKKQKKMKKGINGYFNSLYHSFGINSKLFITYLLFPLE